MTAKMLTPEQVAEYLQVTREQVYRLIRRNELPASKVGRAYRISSDDFDDYLLANSNHAQMRSALFKRVMEIGERNPDLDGDEFLEWLEEQDELIKQSTQRPS